MIASGKSIDVPWIVPSTRGTHLSLTYPLRNSPSDTLQIINAIDLSPVMSCVIPNLNAFVRWIGDDTLIAFSSGTNSETHRISVIDNEVSESNGPPFLCSRPYTSSDAYNSQTKTRAYWDNGKIIIGAPNDSSYYCL